MSEGLLRVVLVVVGLLAAIAWAAGVPFFRGFQRNFTAKPDTWFSVAWPLILAIFGVMSALDRIEEIYRSCWSWLECRGERVGKELN